jgi:RNA recognition motif-containing protein
MAQNLFVAGLPYSMTSDDLTNLFAEFGTVASAKVITDRETGRSKGFGFVEMSTDEETEAAMGALNGKDVNGRALAVNVARPREDRPARSFDNRGGNRGGGRDDNMRSTIGNSYRRSNR